MTTTYPELSLLASFPGHFHIITCSNKKETEVLHSTKIFKGQNFHRLPFHEFCRNNFCRSAMVTMPTQVMWLAVSITLSLCSAALAQPSDNWYYESLLKWLATVHLLLARFSLQLYQWSELMKYPLQVGLVDQIWQHTLQQSPSKVMVQTTDSLIPMLFSHIKRVWA